KLHFSLAWFDTGESTSHKKSELPTPLLSAMTHPEKAWNLRKTGNHHVSVQCCVGDKSLDRRRRFGRFRGGKSVRRDGTRFRLRAARPDSQSPLPSDESDRSNCPHCQCARLLWMRFGERS